MAFSVQKGSLMLRCTSLLLLAPLFFVSCQGNGGSKSIADLTAVLTANPHGRLLSAKPIDENTFVTLRGESGKGRRRLFVESGNDVRALADSTPADAVLTSMSNVMEGRIVMASIVHVSKDEQDSHAETWWTAYDLKSGKALFRKPCRWEGREPGVLSFLSSPLSVLLHADGSFSALVAFREGVKLQNYDAEGNFKSETAVVPSIAGSPRLLVPMRAGFLNFATGGNLLAVVPFYRAELDAIKRAGGFTPTEGEAMDEIISVMTLNRDGKILSSTALNLGKHSADLQSVSVRGNVVAVGGNFGRGTATAKGFVSVLTFNETFTDVARLESKTYRLTEAEDTVAGVAVTADGKVIVAGNGGLKQVKTHSVVATGTAFLSVLDGSAKELGFQWLDLAQIEVMGTLVEANNGPFLIGHRNPPLTHGSGEGLTTTLFRVGLR